MRGLRLETSGGVLASHKGPGESWFSARSRKAYQTSLRWQARILRMISCLTLIIRRGVEYITRFCVLRGVFAI